MIIGYSPGKRQSEFFERMSAFAHLVPSELTEHCDSLSLSPEPGCAHESKLKIKSGKRSDMVIMGHHPKVQEEPT